ncbi:MAG: triose-phosphate isomerase [Desulfitobacteriia bacterium]|jgi:triosephosphate isomerase
MKKRRPLIAGNWKMNKTIAEAREFAVKFEVLVENITDLDILICAPYTTLPALKDELEESIVHLGAQNMHYEREGAYTGEISPSMLKELSCTYVILGHSERREYFLEDDKFIAKKVKAALDNGLLPILCVGESLALREDKKAVAHVRGQVVKGIMDLSPGELRRLVIAYEPIWAIGTGRTASALDAQEMCSAIRSTVSTMAGDVAQEIRILYGGSVKVGNIAEFMAQPDIDGALVGGSSLEAEEFARLIENAR